MDENDLPPIILPEPPKPEEPQEKLPDNVIPMFSKKTTEDFNLVPVEQPTGSTPPPQPPQKRVIRLTPQQVAQIQSMIDQAKGVWMRRASCSFERQNRPQGCTCNYCVYINMMSKRVFDMILQDITYQQQRGKMLFCGPDMVDILQLALERVVEFENSQTQGPPPKQ